MGWEISDGFKFGVRVKEVKACASFMVKSYECGSKNKVQVVDFKIGIGSHLHYDRGGQVYEILFDLLQDNGLMFCISIRKWDGKE